MVWGPAPAPNAPAGPGGSGPTPAVGSSTAYVVQGLVSATTSTSLRVFLTTATNQDQFRRVGHCLFALLIAVVGGLLSRRMYAREMAATASVT